MQEVQTQNLISYGKQIFYKTLVGKIYKYLKKHEEASTAQLNFLVKGKELIRGNGKTYTLEEDPIIKKSLLGVSSTNIFSITKDLWRLNPKKAKEYKQSKVRKYYNRSLRDQTKLPLMQKSTKLFKKIKLLQKLLTEVKNRGKKDHFKNPFKKLEGIENVVEAANKLGRHRFLGMIEGYLITTKYCKFYIVSKIMDKNYQNSPFEIQDKLDVIQERLKKFEKYFDNKKTGDTKEE